MTPAASGAVVVVEDGAVVAVLPLAEEVAEEEGTDDMAASARVFLNSSR